jgi:hypothetical protein
VSYPPPGQYPPPGEYPPPSSQPQYPGAPQPYGSAPQPQYSGTPDPYGSAPQPYQSQPYQGQPYQSAPLPPAKSGAGKTVMIVLLIIGLVLLLCCGGVGWAMWSGYNTYNETIDDLENLSPSGFGGDNGSDTEPPALTGPNDAFNAKVGQCLADDPTDAFPEQQAISSCSADGAAKIVKRFDGTAETSKCDKSESWYYEDFKGTSRDFVVCMVDP